MLSLCNFQPLYKDQKHCLHSEIAKCLTYQIIDHTIYFDFIQKLDTNDEWKHTDREAKYVLSSAYQ